MEKTNRVFYSLNTFANMTKINVREILYTYKAAIEPVSVSLEKCAKAVFDLDDSEQDSEVIAKTVLDAAGVQYVD